MSIRMDVCASRAQDSEIRTLRDSLLGDTHSDWVKFLQEHDGCVPEPNEFGSSGQVSVTKFWGIQEVVTSRELLDDRMPSDFVAIADAEGGNFVCLRVGAPGHGVYFWDHELESVIRLANSFTEFFEELHPPHGDTLRPDVISVWVDPELLDD